VYDSVHRVGILWDLGPPACGRILISVLRGTVFEKYSEKSRRVVFFARYEASQLGAPAIEPEHFLLAIMREDQGLIEGLLQGGASAAAEVRLAIETATRREPRPGLSVDLPISPSGKRIMRTAADEAEKGSSSTIEPWHLLLGLLVDEGSRAATLLRENGVTMDLILQKSTGFSSAVPARNESEAARILGQLSALIEVLIRQGVFSRQELAEELANRYILPDLHATLHSLLAVLVRKGVLNEGDRRTIAGLSDR